MIELGYEEKYRKRCVDVTNVKLDAGTDRHSFGDTFSILL